MSKLFVKLQVQATGALRAGNFVECDRVFAEGLYHLPPSPFHIALDLNFTNPPGDVASHFDAFFRQEAQRFEIAAAYTEMNGFDINPDRWYLDVFAYESYGGQDDLDWISDWQSDSFPDLTLTGMEELQEVFASPAFDQPEFRDAAYVVDLLVVSRFQQLIQRSAPLMKELRFPLLATAHDFDFISEV